MKSESGSKELELADLLKGGTVGIVRDGGMDVLRSDQVEMIVARLAAKPDEEGWTFAKLLSNALLKVRPLGGSELFVKRNGDYYADPEYCGRLIEETRDAFHQARIDKVRLEKSLSTTGNPNP